jgi:hypothetical protein
VQEQHHRSLAHQLTEQVVAAAVVIFLLVLAQERQGVATAEVTMVVQQELAATLRQTQVQAVAVLVAIMQELAVQVEMALQALSAFATLILLHLQHQQQDRQQ